jgi:hypothetical protein
VLCLVDVVMILPEQDTNIKGAAHIPPPVRLLADREAEPW